MFKKSRYDRPFNKQHGKRAQALLKSVSEHLYHINWSLPRQLSWKNSLLLTCQILGLLVNSFSADEEYPILNRDKLTIPIQLQLSEKEKTFSQFLAAFLKSRLIFQDLKKKLTLLAFALLNVRTAKTWLDKYLKSPLSDDLSTSSMVNVPSYFWKLHHSTFIIFNDHCQVNWVGNISVIDMENLVTPC